jgi:hypothetical protein
MKFPAPEQRRFSTHVLFGGLLWVALAGVPDAVAGADLCRDLLLNEPGLIQALHRAAKDDYRVQLLTAEVNGQQKLVVLMGETHIKSPASAAVGREVLDHFEQVGIEGADVDKNWGGKLSNKVISPLFDRMGFKDRPQFWFLRLASKVMGRSGRTEGSTIDQAYAAVFRREVFEELSRYSHDDLASLVRTLEQIPVSERGKAFKSDGVSVVSIEELLSIVRSVPPGAPLPVPQGPRETIWLEEGHVPDLWENLSSIETQVTVGALMAYYATPPFLPQPASALCTLGSLAFSMYQVCGLALGAKFQASRWYQRLFPLSVGLLRARNRTMVGNIAATIESRSDVDQFLVIVGRAHLPEMKHLLLQKGYQPLELPSPEQMEAQDQAGRLNGPNSGDPR